MNMIFALVLALIIAFPSSGISAETVPVLPEIRVVGAVCREEFFLMRCFDSKDDIRRVHLPKDGFFNQSYQSNWSFDYLKLITSEDELKKAVKEDKWREEFFSTIQRFGADFSTHTILLYFHAEPNSQTVWIDSPVRRANSIYIKVNRTDPCLPSDDGTPAFVCGESMGFNEYAYVVNKQVDKVRFEIVTTNYESRKKIEIEIN